MAGVESNRYVSRSCQTGGVTGFQYNGSGDGITDELVECCQKLLQVPTDPRNIYSGPEEAPVRLGRRRNGASDADASAPAGGSRRFRLIGFLSRLHKPKQPAEKTRPRWSARARQRFHKLASWMHALRLALRIPGETPAPRRTTTARQRPRASTRRSWRSPPAKRTTQSPGRQTVFRTSLCDGCLARSKAAITTQGRVGHCQLCLFSSKLHSFYIASQLGGHRLTFLMHRLQG
ncbi:uncharacterized protein LOC125946116 [Dermacentor silvarum]|uniref:uncharacterized protein LOC125946116 n=1 Tax=Dermacentor silvarum TaxID=543639 RepID=UPI0021018D19|nr:uncharacterized protein LOC125946116 [Dermacentor silvarum]